MSPADAETPYVWVRSGRSLTGMVTVIAVWAALAAAYLMLDAAAWIVWGLAIFTLPALYDLIANPQAGLSLSENSLDWHSGRRHATLSRTEIDHLRLETRLDFSVRATAVLVSGRKVRLPFESTPPHQSLEAACQARGLRTERHHFLPGG
ncbi:MAG: hypothetical protein AAF636_19930 [Pseudomonadota bacterium]